MTSWRNDAALRNTYEGSIEEGEALDVEHVDFVDEEDAGRDLGFTLFPPFRHLGVDLKGKILLQKDSSLT